MFDDPNTSSFAVNFANRIVTRWLGGTGQALRTRSAERARGGSRWGTAPRRARLPARARAAPARQSALVETTGEIVLSDES